MAMTEAELDSGLTADTQRIKLRRALRRARLDARLRANSVARNLEWSPSKVVRIEQGFVGVSITDLRALLTEYGVTDQQTVAELEELARNSRRLTYAAYKQYTNETSLSLFGAEQNAQQITKFEPTFIPGLLQTRQYAEGLFRAFGQSEEEIKARADLRLLRQEMFNEDTYPALRFVIGEAALARNVGGLQTMAEQLQRIYAISRKPGIEIQVMRLSSGPHPQMGGAFTVLEFDDDELTTMVYVESPSGNSLIEDDKDKVTQYLEDFEKISNQAEPAERTGEVLTDIALRWLETNLDLTESG